tara:strand:+ start:149 stop:523 length:375 start_codon:yes stop_codon:yes gene_type:complete
MGQINKKAFKRASKAIKCLAFNSNFYKDAQINGLNAEEVFEMRDKYASNTSNWFKNSERVENEFRWLITIGILRREVDGQGLTSSVRLTPLGRQIIERKPKLLIEKTLPSERFSNWVFRKLIFM